MANPIWISGEGQKLVNLGTVTEGTYFEYTLDAYDPNGGSVTYKFLAGSLPPGIRVNPNGYIQGGPYLDTVENQTESFDFTVRATDQNGLVSDKTFTIIIANVSPPVISVASNLGQAFDGEYYSNQLTIETETNPNVQLTWALSSGSLPNGLSLSTSGLISGFIYPLVNTNDNSGLYGFNITPFNEFGFENAPTYLNNNYQFSITVFDGANYSDRAYNLYVVSKEDFTTDVALTTDNTYLSVDHDNLYVPIITTPSQELPEVRSNSKFAFQFQAIDPNQNQVSYALGLGNSSAAGFDESNFDIYGFDQENMTIPPGLVMDTEFGWLSGIVGAQPQAIQTYTFEIYAYETNNTNIQSVPISYTMNVLGDITNSITWTTSANLGMMDNGTVSELSVSAVNNSGRELTYSMVGDSSLPQGLEMNSSGLIVGRTGFEFFTLDQSTTTIDGVVSGYDNSYTFTAQATTIDGTASSQQTFTILINNYNLIPYEDVYLRALPTLDQRETFLNIVNNNDIFPESLLYRSSDPNFGRARDIRSLFLAGIQPSDVSAYAAAMGTNTFNKRINFGAINTAIAVDANFNTKYEVVYIQLENDYEYNITESNSVYDRTIEQYVYNNSYSNMSNVLSNALGYANIGALPDWMTSPQSNKKVLGFTRAIVLAYTVPGASNLIAYRLGASGISFNQINFVADRYDLDNSYSANYNIPTKQYTLGRETTFDRIDRVGTVTASADYGVTNLAFNQINNQNTTYINSLGGLDGKTDYQDGETLIFLQQENFGSLVGQYDGWVESNNNNQLVNGWVEFIGSKKYSTSTPGLPANPLVGQTVEVDGIFYIFVSELDNNGNIVDQVWKLANLRSSVWTINIDSNNNVTLTPSLFQRNVQVIQSDNTIIVQQVPSISQVGDTIQVNYGVQHSESLFLYNPTIQIGQSVPAFTIIQTSLHTSTEITRFDGYGTRFINNRISYSNPEVGDSWIKFPNNGPLL